MKTSPKSRSTLGAVLRLASLGALASATAFAAPSLKPVDLDAPPPDEGQQEAAPDEGQPEPGPSAPESPPEGSVVQPGKPPPPGVEPHPTVPPGQDYTVKSGDTLWDISGSYLQSPWFWPKLWSYNPQIANPHWIYPGNEIRFYPGGGTQVAAEAPPPPAQEPEDDVTASAKIGYIPPGTTMAATQGFVTARELAQSGEIVGSPEEKQLLASNDMLYLRFGRQKPKPGDQLVIFRTIQEVHHPQTGNLIGYMTELRGTLKITANGRPLFTGRVDKSFDTIERGDLVGPWGEKYLRNVSLKENDRTLGGFVVATLTPELFNIGEGHMVFVDRGRKDGVQEGNTFDIVIKREGLEEDYDERWMPGYPVETIGRLLIVDTKENASEALVINSVREVKVGDHVQMLAQQR